MVADTDSEDSLLQVGPPRQAASPQPTRPSPVSRRTKTKFIVSRVVKDILWGRSTGMSAWITRTSAIFIVPHYPCCEDGRQARSGAWSGTPGLHSAPRPERRKPAVRNLHDSEDKPMSKTTVVEKWVDEAAALTGPSKVTWADGSKQEYDRLVEEMLGDGTLLELTQKTYPGCFLHRSHPQDVARTEQLTFICSREADDAGPTNNWMAPAEAKAKAAGYFKNSMKDRRMWVIPYLMGPAGSAAGPTRGHGTHNAHGGGRQHNKTRGGEGAIGPNRGGGHLIPGPARNG